MPRCFHDGCINEAYQRVTYAHGAGGTDTFSDLCDGHLPADDAAVPAPYASRTIGPIPEPEASAEEASKPVAGPRLRRQEAVHAALDAEEPEPVEVSEELMA